MKMLMKLHSNSFSIIAPYIVSPIVNLFVKNPKMLCTGDKVRLKLFFAILFFLNIISRPQFKVNIKNICHQLLSTMDEKTRKHVYASVDESTKDVYEELFREIKKK